ncbi:unannotated protein [freshwater metagenome]|uniref:Unannotated protein n=1 Tax=freshwater metagenome TaxID=449393 RepID=A0A6J6SHL6_9ZZZZ
MSTTFDWITGRTVPSDIGRTRSRATCCWTRPGTVRRVHPPETVRTMDGTLVTGTARPTLAAALSHPCSGLSTASAGVPVALLREEET